jgi:hypothetical protein
MLLGSFPMRATLLGAHRIAGETLPKKIDCGQEEFGRFDRAYSDGE